MPKKTENNNRKGGGTSRVLGSAPPASALALEGTASLTGPTEIKLTPC